MQLLLLSIGRILNRFSKDTGFLDDLLPYTFCEYLLVSITALFTWYRVMLSIYNLFDSFFMQFLLRFLAIIFTATGSNVWVIIPAFVLIVIFLAFRWYYLKTSRGIKRLEAAGQLRRVVLHVLIDM